MYFIVNCCGDNYDESLLLGSTAKVFHGL